jgi:hypothetical protein
MSTYRTMGKYWNVGIDYGRLPATPRQLRRLWHLSGRKVDYRGRALNRYQASEEIERLEKDAAERQEMLKPTDMKHAFYEALMIRASARARDVAQQWLETHPVPVFRIYDPSAGTSVPVYGRVGHAVLKVTSRRDTFARWASESGHMGQKGEIELNHVHAERPELDLQLAALSAALSVLEGGSVHSVRIYAADNTD